MSSSYFKDANLQDDTKLEGMVKDLHSYIDTLEADIQKALVAQKSRHLTTNDKIKLDSYLAYLCSTLFWIQLKLQGEDVSKHGILHDLSRARESMARDKEIDASLAAPRLNMPATKRFIAAGMHTRFVDKDGQLEAVPFKNNKRSSLGNGQ
ncbi:uncharacterized protein Rrp47 [Drosophila bipectinata]|uniref:uncharacterized protein Rrp47 n=1 Tax=Drosophila bipectinata TaxID=42026 RepID=UPI0007E88546|nr:uncharacterized protein LOC108124620 [Drosophila bipectinata]